MQELLPNWLGEFQEKPMPYVFDEVCCYCTFYYRKMSLFISEFTQMCITTIANLMQTSIKEGKSRQYFSRDKEIVPYIESHWEYIVSAGISSKLKMLCP